MIIPQPFQYQGSKRILAPVILKFLPAKFRRLIEPFAGSAAITLACAARSRAANYWINDFNQPLAELLNLMINRPEELADNYTGLWRGEASDALEHFFALRAAWWCGFCRAGASWQRASTVQAGPGHGSAGLHGLERLGRTGQRRRP